MLKRLLILAFALSIGQCALSSASRAQPANPCVSITIWYFPEQVPFGWWVFSSLGQGSYSYLIGAWVCSPPPESPSCPYCGRPIALSTGDTVIEATDLRIPGLGGGLSLQRTWNSIWPASLSTFQTGIFGPNWRSTYEERIVLGVDNYIKYSRGDGSFWSFGIGSGTTNWKVLSPANISATLSTDTSVNSYYTLTFQNGEQRRFDQATGKLIAIIDRNGNTTTVAYDSSGRLSTVTDAASHTLTFTYGGNSSNLVTGISSSVGISYSYAYDTQGRLIQVTKPDQTTVVFTYNAQSLITSVNDANGKVLESHTYDGNARGLTSARAGGVESVTITYP